MGSNAGRNDAALFSNGAGPRRLRVRPLVARSLAVAVFVAFAALLALTVQAETPEAGADAPQFTVSREETQSARSADTTTARAADGGRTGVRFGEVPLDWSLIPDGLGAGDEFRMLFLSSRRHDATSSRIVDYNILIKNLADAGHADIQPYKAFFRVIGCTRTVDARDNTKTTYTDSNKGVPIYWLGGAKVADDYEDFYDGGWTNGIHTKNEFGSAGHDGTSVNINNPFTGCDDQGRAFKGDYWRNLGASANYVRIGQAWKTPAHAGPIDGHENAPKTELRPFYGLSQVFHVGSTDATLSALQIAGTGGYRLKPMFRPEKQVYALSVGESVDQITITPTPNHSAGTYSVKKRSGVRLQDADPDVEGFQIDLLHGLVTTFRVRVRAEDTVTTKTYEVVVTREPTLVPANWSLIPSGFTAGDQFRLLFLSSTTRDISSVHLSAYNQFISDIAAAGHADIQAYKSDFRVVGCNATTSAILNTGTVYSSNAPGPPIYWLNGNKVADGYADFYDGSWDDEVNIKNELGENGRDTSIAENYPVTGCNHAGGVVASGTNGPIGTRLVTVGRLNTPGPNFGPLFSNDQLPAVDQHPFYGLSSTFVVASNDDGLSGLELKHRDGAAIALTPTFASGTTDYTASVLNEVDVVTVIPTLNHASATYEITDARGTTLDDADPDADSFQVTLPHNAHTINVVVTAQDDINTQTYTVVVTRGPLFVPDTLSPLPTGLVQGDQFRLLFLSSATRDGSSSDIDAYNEFIRDTAAAGHSEIQAYSSSFRAVGCTTKVDARDNTGTTYTNSNQGVPIYWLGGAKVADNYQDFYDGSWDDEVNDKDQTGADGPDTLNSRNYPITGCDHDGTELIDGAASLGLGSSTGVVVAQPHDSALGAGPLSGTLDVSRSNTRPMYGLSGVLEVASADATLIDLALKDDLNTDIPLIPTFASETTLYKPRVATSVAEVTIIPTVNESHATYEFRNRWNGNLLPDSNPNKDGFQRTFYNNRAYIDVVVRADHRATTKTYRVVITRGATPVPDVWSLIPPGLVADEEFRLLFLSSTMHDGSSSDIADYNTFISDLAAVGHDDIQEYSSGFRVVGCTVDVDARDHTVTTYTSTDKGIPIYWLGGAKVADDYEDFYDGSWDDEANDKDESGANGPNTSLDTNYPLTGCDHDGTEAFQTGASRALGNDSGFPILIRVGRPNASTNINSPLSSAFATSAHATRPMYGLSEVFRVVSTDATLSDLAVKDNAGAAITLTPTFTSGTTDYTAFVIDSVDEVTVIPTVNDSNARYEIQDGSGTALVDADPNENDFQFALSEGANTIKVEVTAPDEAYTHTYTVVVTLTAPVTISADSTSAIYGEDLVDFTLTRSGSVDHYLTVTVNLMQTQAFLAAASLSQTVVFAPGSATAELTILDSQFRRLASGTVAEKGALTATLADGAGYSIGTPNSAAVDIIIAATIGFGELSYTVSEEAGSPLTFTVIVRTGEGAPQPDATISVGLGTILAGSATSPDDFQSLSEDLDFSPSDFTADGTVYEARKSIDIPIIDDDIADSGETFLIRLQFAPGLLDKYWYNFVDSTGQRCGSTCVVTATITDTDPGVTVSKTALAVVEGDAAGDSYTVVLNTLPRGNVLVGVAGQLGTAVTASPATLTFTNGNWFKPQTVTVTAGEDADEVDDTVSLSHSATSRDSDYHGVTIAGVVVTAIDNDKGPSVTVSKSALTVTEGDLTGDSYTVILNTLPTADVTVTVAGHAGTDVTPTPVTLTFTSTTWATAQTVTVTADHDLDEVNDAVSLTHSATSADSDYDAITIAGVTVTVGDKDRPVVTVSADMAEANGNLHRVMFDLPWPSYTVTRTGSAARSLTVDLNVPSSPYTSQSSFTVKIAQGARSAQLEFDDSYFNQASVAGTLTVEVVESAPYVAGPSASISITRIAPAITLEIEDGTSFEVSEDAGSVTFTVVARTAPGLPAPSRGWETETGFGLSWGLETVPGSPGATAGSDFVEFSGVSSITGAWVAHGDHFRHVSTYDLEILDDMIPEPEEELSLRLVANTLPLLLGSYLDLNCPDVSCLHTVTIIDDDTAQVTGVMVTPGDGQLVVNWTAVGNATGYQVQWKSGVEDYNTGDRQATVTPGTTTSYSIGSLMNGTEYTVRVTATRTGANDGLPSAEVKGTPAVAGVTVSKTTLTVTEEDSTGDTYTVVLVNQPTADVVVTVAGHASTDVTPAPATLTFTPMTWDTAQTVTVKAGDDSDTTNDTVSLTHTAASTDTVYDGVTIAGVTVTVEDNDTAQVMGVMVTPGNAQLVLNWTAVDNATGYQVQWKSGGEDYNTGDRQATVTPGTTTSYTIGSLMNGTEYTVQVIATRTGANDGPPSEEGKGTPTLTAVGVTVTPTAVPIAEGRTAAYTVVLDTEPAGNVTVTVNDPTDNTDVTSDPASLTFTDQNWNTAQTVTVMTAHDVDGDDDTATITHTVASTADPAYAGISTDDVTVTVDDDETASTEVILAVDPAWVDEGTALTNVRLTAELDEAPRAELTIVTVTVGAPGDTAIEGVDYETIGELTLNIRAGQTSTFQTIQFRPVNTGIGEGDEYLSISGTTMVTSLTVTGTQLLVVDDEVARNVTLSAIPGSVAEDGGPMTVVVTATLNSLPYSIDSPVTVMVGASLDSATEGTDYTSVDDFTITVAAGSTSATGEFQLTPTNDSFGEGDMTISVTGRGAGPPAVVQGTEVTIVDDDTLSTEISLSVSSDSLGEGAGATTLTVTGTLNNDVRSSPTSVTVIVGASIDVAVEGADYETVNEFTLTIDAGQTTGFTTFLLVPTDDAIDEVDEALTVSGTTAATGLVVTTTSVTITDDDTDGVTVDPTEVTVTEGGTVTYTVVLDTEPAGNVTVTVNDPTDNTDVTADPATLTFTDQNWNVAQTVTVSAAQDGDAADETATVTHTVASTADADYQGISTDDVAVTLDDVPAVTVSFEQGTYTVAEGSSITVKVQLSVDPERTVTVPINHRPPRAGRPPPTTRGCPPASPSTAATPRRPSVLRSGLRQRGRRRRESVKLTFGTLPAGVTEGTTNESVVSITDDDVPAVTVSFEQGTYTVAEGSSTTVKVQLSVDAGADGDGPHQPQAPQGGATTADYSGVPTSVTFNSTRHPEDLQLRSGLRQRGRRRGECEAHLRGAAGGGSPRGRQTRAWSPSPTTTCRR